VPFGYDYSCDKPGGCKEIYRSFNSDESYNIGEILVNNVDKENALNQEFMIGNARRDGIGLGMSKSKFLKFEVG